MSGEGSCATSRCLGESGRIRDKVSSLSTLTVTCPRPRTGLIPVNPCPICPPARRAPHDFTNQLHLFGKTFSRRKPADKTLSDALNSRP